MCDFASNGAMVADLARKYEVSTATIGRWKSKFGRMDVSDAQRLKALEEENAELNRLLVDAMLENADLQDLLGRNWWCPSRGERPSPCSMRTTR